MFKILVLYILNLLGLTIDAKLTLLLLIILPKLTKLIINSIKLQISYISPIDITSHGSWALITGASDGIGKGYAFELAKRGLNICLIARNERKLTIIAEKIRQQYKVKVTFIIFDFGTDNYQQLKLDLEKQSFWKNESLAILVNNVGVNPFDDVEEKGDFVEYCGNGNNVDRINNLEKNVRINNNSVFAVTALVGQIFYKKNKGIIINMSSTVAEASFPFTSLYNATKVFDLYFSESIRKEFALKAPGVIIQSLKPGFVRTKLANPNLSKCSNPEVGTFFAPSVSKFCHYAINSIGWRDNTCGYWGHSILCSSVCLIEFLPEKLASRLIYYNIGRGKKDD